MIGRPLIVCELLNLSRGPRMYLLRAGFAVFMAALAAIVWPWGGDAAALEHGGRSVFLAFFWAEFAAATLLVPALVAPAIAWERERKTLDLLSVAPVSDLEIVSGKFVAGAALSLSVLAAGLPVGVAAMVLGGTSPSGLLTTVLHLGAHAVFVCSLSIVASASVARSGPATALAVLLTGAFGGVSAIVSAIFGNALSGAGHPMLSRLAFSSLSPWVGIGRDLLGFETGWLDRCGAWAMLGVFSLIAIRLAGTILRASRSPGGARRRPVPVAAAATAAIPMAILPRPAATWHAAPPPAAPPAPPRPAPAPVSSSGANPIPLAAFAPDPTALPRLVMSVPPPAPRGPGRRRLPITGNPVAWKERHFDEPNSRTALTILATLGSLGILAFGAAGFLIAPALSAGSGDGLRQAVAWTALGQLALLLVLVVGSGAGTLGLERELGTLPLLLSTGMSPAAILRGKLQASLRALLPVLGIAALHVILATFTIGPSGLAAALAFALAVPFAWSLAAACSLAAGAPRRAAALTAFILFSLWAVPWVASLALSGRAAAVGDFNPFVILARCAGAPAGILDLPDPLVAVAFLAAHAAAVPALLGLTAARMESTLRA